MKKNKCPYINQQGNCTHRDYRFNKRSKKKMPDCPFSNEEKCELHNSWFNLQSAARMARTGSKDYMRENLKDEN